MSCTLSFVNKLEILNLLCLLFNQLYIVFHPLLLQITNCLDTVLIPSLPESPPDVEALRVYLILPEFHMFEEPKHYSTLLGPFANSILNLDKPGSKVLGKA